MGEQRISGLETPEELASAIASGADPGAADEFGTTPLMRAARFNALEAVMILVRAGVDLGARDRFGNSALFYAAYSSEQDREPVNTALLEAAEKSGAQLEPATDPARLATVVALAKEFYRFGRDEGYDAYIAPSTRVAARQSRYRQPRARARFKHWELRAAYNLLLDAWNDDMTLDVGLEMGIAPHEAARRSCFEAYEKGWLTFLANYKLERVVVGDVKADTVSDAQRGCDPKISPPTRGDLKYSEYTDGDPETYPVTGLDILSWGQMGSNVLDYFTYNAKAQPHTVYVPGATTLAYSIARYAVLFDDLAAAEFALELRRSAWYPHGDIESAWPYMPQQWWDE